MSLLHRSAYDLAALVMSGDTSSRALVDECLEIIARENPQINAALALCPEMARTSADRVDSLIASGESPGPLAGVPVLIKDNLSTANIATTAGSSILENHVPPFNATAVQRLIDAGAIVVGKANLDEFAMGSSTENSAYGPTHNPWKQHHVPGGSSGGSAAAVAAGWTPLTLGSDTGGSIRQPAALCGVYGLKPTWGRISRFGLIAFASSLDQVGPITRSAQDLATSLQVLAGHDPADATSKHEPVPDYSESLSLGITGLRIGRCRAWMEGDGVDPAISKLVDDALQSLSTLGAEVVDIDLPDTQQALAAYYVLAPAEASSNLARFDGIRYGKREEARDVHALYENTRGKHFGPEVQRRILLGTFALSDGYRDAYYQRAQQARAHIARGFANAFSQCDVIASPTSPVVAPKIGESSSPLTMYRMDEFTIGANLAGLPALSLPCGRSNQLPVGLQVIAPAFEEARLLQLAGTYEAKHGQPEVAS